MSSFVVEGGTVVTAEGMFSADVAVSDGQVVAVGRDLAGGSDTVVDAVGKLVLPGCVDMHTHLEAPHNELDDPSDDQVSVDDFRSGTIAAAVGGTTTIVDFAAQASDHTLSEARTEWEAKLVDRPPAVHVGLHMIVTSLEFDGADEDLASLCEAGITSYKLFLAYRESPLSVDDNTLFRVAQVAARSGALVMAHCENGDAIAVLQRQALARGETDAIYHARTRPPLTEAEAIARVGTLCQIAGAPAYVMHVSCREGVEAIAAARRGGVRIWGETCPHYLAFTEEIMLQGGLEAAKYLVTPPLRPGENHDALWTALSDGTLSVVSTDHCPYMTTLKEAAPNFFEIPNGVPGVENRLEVMYELAVRGGRLNVSRLVDLLSTSPARLFGMFPKKGALAVGSDADIVIFDPERRKVITAGQEMSRCDYSLYEGMEVAGSVERVFFRGEQIVEDGRYVAGRELGAFLPRARFGESERMPYLAVQATPAATS